MKISWQQAEVLILIADHSDIEPGKFWIPPNKGPSDYRSKPVVNTAYSPTLGREVIVAGAASANQIKALVRKGLVKFHRNEMFAANYYCHITEKGRMQIEKWRETDTWPVTVAVR